MADELGASASLEISSIGHVGLEELVLEIIRLGLEVGTPRENGHQPRRGGCLLQ